MTQPTSQALRVIALGSFDQELPPLAPRLAALNVAPLRCADLARLPAVLDDHDVLLTDLDWLGELAPAQREDLSRRVGKAAGWIALTAGARFKEQVAWQRSGVSHFFPKPLAQERLAALMEDLHDRLAGPPLRVILLDDEESALSYYGAIMERAGIVVAATQDPLIVLDAIADFRPDLLLVDIEMPGCRGPELVTIVRQHAAYEHLPVIFLTAMESMNDLLLARQAAAEDFLAKPVAPELLLAAVNSQARRYRARLRAETHHARQEARARYRLEQLQLALDKHAVVSATDAAGNITYVNEKFCELSGYSRQELVGRNHRILKSGKHRDALYAELWQTISGGRIWHGEICNRSKDGGHYWVEATIVPFLDSKGKPTQYISIRTDITALKAKEAALRQSDERLRRSQAFANIGTWDWDIQTNEAFWSERVAPLLGQPAGNLQPSFDNFIAAVHPEDRQAVIDAISACVERDVPYEIEHRTLWPDGQVRWLLEKGAIVRDAAGKPLHMLGVVQDIDARKRAELALAESERHLREAHAMARIGHWDADMTTGTVHWSDETYAIYGRGRETFVPSAEALFAAIHPDDIELLREAERATETTGHYNVVHRIIRPDGSIRHVHELGRAELNAAGRVVRVVGTVQDITERRSVELALAERERLLSAILQNTRQGFWFVDLDGITTDVNPAMCAILARPREEIVGHSIFDFVDERNADIFHVQMEERRRGLANPYEVALLRPDGSLAACVNTPTPLLDQRGRRVGTVGLLTDISEIKRTGDRLTLFRRIFDVSNQCIGIADGQGRLFYQNRATAEAVGYSDAEIEDQPFSLFLPEGMSAGLTSEIYDVLTKGKNWVGQLPILRKDGSSFISSSNIGFVKNENGDIQYIFNIFSDFSSELARRGELARAKETAERANQAKSDFLSSMSHELRTPMNAIIGFAQMLEYDEALNDDQQDNVEEILKAGRHLLDLINEVLDLAKIESGRIELSLEAVELAGVVEDCQQLIQPLAAQRRIAMSFDVPAGCSAHTDRVRLKQVLLNLLSNAVKYNREGGSIHLGVSAGPSRLRIAVADTGVGIPPERIEEIFQPFNRLDAEYSEIEGTGIGLTITLRLVEMMGGKVGVDSQIGRGSTFWIELPGATPPTLAPIAAIGPAEHLALPASRQYLVLAIDDNPANLKLTAQILARRPHLKLITAHTPELGIELALAHRPDLTLLDINLPGMDGYQVLEVFKADTRLKERPVVAVTANAMPRDIERGLAAGFAAYLTKPLIIDEFLKIVDAQLAVGDQAGP